MGRAIEGVKGREWEERLRRYADSQLTVGEFCDWEGEAGERSDEAANDGKCGHRGSRVGIECSTEPRVLPAGSCGRKIRGNCWRDDTLNQYPSSNRAR
jgi:hypothetical protein